MIVVTFKISREDLEKLNEIARSLGLPRSEIIRKAIKKYILEDGATALYPPQGPVTYKKVVIY